MWAFSTGGGASTSGTSSIVVACGFTGADWLGILLLFGAGESVVEETEVEGGGRTSVAGLNTIGIGPYGRDSAKISVRCDRDSNDGPTHLIYRHCSAHPDRIAFL